MTRTIAALSACLMWLSPSPSQAEVQRSISASRVTFGDLIPSAPAEVKDLDLGPAPPAGSSRLFTAAELQLVAQRAGTKLSVVDSVRAVRATMRWSQAALRELVKSKLEGALPPHARLLHFEPPKSLVTATAAELSRTTLPQLPNRQGTVHTSAVLELTVDGQLEHRLVVPVTLELGSAPKQLGLPQGTPITLVIRLGTAQVSAAAITLEPTTVGSTALLRVVKTRKTLRGRILTTSMAEVVNQ